MTDDSKGVGEDTVEGTESSVSPDGDAQDAVRYKTIKIQIFNFLMESYLIFKFILLIVPKPKGQSIAAIKLIQLFYSMLILISCLTLFITALALIVLSATQPGARYTWLLALGGAALGLISVFLWLTQMPFDLILPAWQPRALFVSPILFRADKSSWPFALSISALILSVLLTAVVRSTVTSSYAWAGTLALGGLGLLAVTADNPFTLLLVWSALDLTELVIQLRSVEGLANNEKVVISFSTRVLGSFLLLWANIVSVAKGNAFDFQSIAPDAGLYLVIAAGLRLGVLPLHLPYSSESILRRGFGTSLRLISVASSLALLAHVPVGSLNSIFTPTLIIFAIIAALYGSWMWLRAPEELTGRPFWIISLAAFSVISALSGNPIGSAAWGCALILVGGALFLASVQHAWLNRALLISVWSLSSLPFSLTASAWIVNLGFFIPFLIASQALLIAGFIRHVLRPSGRSSQDLQENWTHRVYPTGIILLIAIQILLALIGWDGARQIGAWLQAVIVSIVTVGLVWATPRFRILNPVRAHWLSPASPNSNSIYNGLRTLYRSIEKTSNAITIALEGEGGIMWALLFLILFISLLTQGIP